MNTLLQSAILRAVSGSLIAVGLAACGNSDSDNSGGNNTPAVGTTSSNAAVSSVAVSSESATSSLSNEPVIVRAAEECGQTLICETFEAQSFNSGWSETGNIERTTDRAYSGDYSLKFNARGNGYNRNFIGLNLNDFTEVQDEVYGRMMMYTVGVDGNGGDFVFVQAEGAPGAGSSAPEDTNVMYRYRVNGSNGHLMANYDTYPNWSTDCWDHSQTKLPTDTWACLEWRFNSATDTLEYWLDGEKITDLGVGEGCLGQAEEGEWRAPAQFDNLLLGIEQYHNNVPAREIYLDDIKIADSQIGCPTDDAPAASSEMASSSAAASSEPAVALGKAEWDEYMCGSCHGDGTSLGLSGQALIDKIANDMPKSSPSDCDTDCAAKVADYIENVLRS